MAQKEQKEKVINARVSEDLYEKIIEKSKKHRRTVSSLVRNLVEDAIDVHNDFADIIEDKVRDIVKADQRTKPVGYQEIRVARTCKCSACEVRIPKDSSAYLEIYIGVEAGKHILCKRCYQKRHDGQ